MVYENEDYDPRTSLQPSKACENELLKVPMLFATRDTKVEKEGLFKTRSIDVLHIKSSIENIGIDLLFKDTRHEKSELQDWIKHVREAEEINKQKVNRLNIAIGII